MQFMSNQELVSELAKLMIRTQNPYWSPQTTKSTLLSWAQGVEGMHSHIEVLSMNKAMVTIDCVHELLVVPAGTKPEFVQREIMQFNDMMDRVLLPTFLWMNPATHKLELHWQETMKANLDMQVAEQMFEQSAMLRNSMEKRLRLKFYGELTTKELH